MPRRIEVPRSKRLLSTHLQPDDLKASHPDWGANVQLCPGTRAEFGIDSAPLNLLVLQYFTPYCAMYNLTQGRYVAPFVILTLQGLTLELKEGNNGRVHHGTTIQAGVFTIHL